MHRGILIVMAAAALVAVQASWGAAGGAAAPTAAPPAKAAAPPAKATTPTKERLPDPVTGEYSGKVSRPGQDIKAEAKVIGTGSEEYEVVLTWTEGGKGNTIRWPARVEGGKVIFDGQNDAMEVVGVIADQKLTATVKGKFEGKFNLEYTRRTSRTEGDPPLEGGEVLLPYAEGKPTSTAEWTNDTWKAQPDGSMLVGKGNNSTKKSFGDCRLHIEFYIPYEPDCKGQDRGASGVFLQGRYEIQILDSFGQDPTIDGCGAITGVRVPRPGAPLPPARWQTYDIVFRAPVLDGDTVLKPAIITVVQNGMKIHDIIKVDKATAGGVAGPPVEKSPLMLQEHGSPVRFRNIWIKELKEGEMGGL
jgi:hypothetical protein